MVDSSKNTSVEAAVYTLPEVAAMLKVSRKTVHNRIRMNKRFPRPLPYTKGTAIRFPKSVIDRFLRTGCE